MALRLVRWDLDGQHEVGGVSRGRQNTSALQSFVAWAFVHARIHFAVCGRSQPHNGHFRVQVLGTGLLEALVGRIPARALQVEPIDEAAVLGPKTLVSSHANGDKRNK